MKTGIRPDDLTVALRRGIPLVRGLDILLEGTSNRWQLVERPVDGRGQIVRVVTRIGRDALVYADTELSQAGTSFVGIVQQLSRVPALGEQELFEEGWFVTQRIAARIVP